MRVHLTVPRFVPYVKENRRYIVSQVEKQIEKIQANGWEFNGEDELMQYWRGVFDTALYFKEELGMEDAFETNLAQEALEYLFEDE